MIADVVMPKTLESCRVDWPAPDNVPDHLKVDLNWANGFDPNDLVDPYVPGKWLSGEDIPPLLYAPLPPGGPAHGAAGQLRGMWVVTHYEDIERVYTDNERFSNVGQAEFQAYVGETFRSIPLAIDPPEHSKYRMYLMPYFSPARLNRMQDGIRQIVVEMLDSFASKGEVDIAWDFARVYPVRIFMDLMGFPKSMFEQFLAWEWDILHSNDPEKIQSSMRGILAYLRSFIREKEQSPDENLTSAIVHGKIEGREPTDDEKIGMVWFLWLGGLDTVAASIAHMFRRMGRQPELQQQLRANPEIIPTAVEEFLRSHPVVNSTRHAKLDFEWHGQLIRKGDHVQCLNAAGNFDPARFAAPENLDLTRKPNRHFTFIAGVHICLGAPLARREIRILLEEWFRRMPDFQIKPGTDTRVYPGLLSIRHLHIQWDASKVGHPA